MRAKYYGFQKVPTDLNMTPEKCPAEEKLMSGALHHLDECMSRLQEIRRNRAPEHAGA
jgi:hypothetical protein